GVSGLPQQLGDCKVLGLERNGSVATNAHMTRVQAGHERSPRRGTNGAAGVTLGEAHTFGSQAINVGSFDSGLPVAADVAITQVVGEDKDYTGFVFGLEFGLKRVRGRLGGGGKLAQ